MPAFRPKTTLIRPKIVMMVMTINFPGEASGLNHSMGFHKLFAISRYSSPALI